MVALILADGISSQSRESPCHRFTIFVGVDASHSRICKCHGMFLESLYSHKRYLSVILNCSQYLDTIIFLISVGVRKLQVAILARSSREMSLTVRIV